jgi:hypothetical protein
MEPTPGSTSQERPRATWLLLLRRNRQRHGGWPTNTHVACWTRSRRRSRNDPRRVIQPPGRDRPKGRAPRKRRSSSLRWRLDPRLWSAGGPVTALAAQARPPDARDSQIRTLVTRAGRPRAAAAQCTRGRRPPRGRTGGSRSPQLALNCSSSEDDSAGLTVLARASSPKGGGRLSGSDLN